ncbi:CAAX protease self-immunity [Microlunatus sagamiharensis]|uniref:CAAX protease self-immunity n=1 Tax=Microlunatus sagamiharensis TaxID=546874 RepID=A0A1H2N5J9_9ACTN|nr:CPBP family intramembrane glutamic endopeptidase [Microlunatus sagamiharensis]SDV00843.1 CAAX protease self-immunity [Microlunatus sagamiharensis]
MFLLVAAAVPVGRTQDTLIGVAPFDAARPSFTIGLWVGGNLLLGLLIPVSLVLTKLAYGAAPGSLFSVAGRFRWAVFARAAVVVVPLWIVYALVLQPFLGTGAPRWTALHLALCVVAVVTVPLQSAGEEFLFRGLVFRAVGARFARPLVAFVVAATITAVEFGLIHGASDGWGTAYYVAMGVCFAVLAERTGGLEIPVLLHATNNMVLLVPVLLAGQLSSVSTPSGPILLVPILLVVIVTTLMWRTTPRLTKLSADEVAAAA